MPRPKKQAQPVEDPASTRPHSAGPVAFVILALVAASAAVMWIMVGGRLLVTVSIAEGVELEGAPMVCVYEGDVSSQIEAGRAADMPQAIAAAKLEPGVEMELSGRWKGTYTLAVVGSDYERYPGTDTVVCQVDSGETRVLFNYCPISG